MRKVVIFLILAGVVGYVAVKYFRTDAKQKGGRGARSTVVAVETAKIETADLGDRVIFTGSIKAEERYDASPKISGIIRSVNFNVGDRVKRGEVLAVLDDDEYRLIVEQEEASLRVAQANANDAEKQLTIIRRDFERIDNLWRERVISAQEYDKTDATLKAQEAKYESAIANVRLAEAMLKTAQVKLGYTRVMADWDEGPDERVIGQRYKDAGGLVAANTPILSVLDIDRVRAIISVSEKQYPRIALGDKVIVSTDAFPGREFHGQVARIPQELGALTREAEIEVAVDNRALALKPGMFIRADIEFQRRKDAVAAPLAAVVRRDDGRRGVYVVGDGTDTVAFQPVVEGIVDGDLVELVNAPDMVGLEVVVLGQHLLKDGITVKVANAATARAVTPGGDPAGKNGRAQDASATAGGA